MCVLGGQKYSGFFWKFDVLCFLKTPFLRFVIFPYYRRISSFSEILLGHVWTLHQITPTDYWSSSYKNCLLVFQSASVYSWYPDCEWYNLLTQQISCSNSVVETLEKSVKLSFKFTKKTPELCLSVWFLYCWLSIYFTDFSSVSVVDFEQGNVCWEIMFSNLSGTLYRREPVMTCDIVSKPDRQSLLSVWLSGK